MNNRLFGVLPCVSIACVLVLSCGTSDGGSGAAAGSAGLGGSAALGGEAGASGRSGGGMAGVDHGAGAAGETEAGSGGSAGFSGAGVGADGASAGSNDGGAAGSVVAPPVDTSPLSPSAVPDLAFWLDGNAQSFSDKDANFPTPADSGRVRNIPEALPLTGTWAAPSPLERPIRQVGALELRPAETSTGYFLQDTAGTIQTDDSTIAISYRTMNSNSAQGSFKGPVNNTTVAVGVYFAGDGLGLYYNHKQVALKKHIARGLHATIIIRFSAAGVVVQYDVEGFRSSESIADPIAHESASNFIVGYDGKLNASMYGFVSQAVGVNRAVSDAEAGRLMTWLSAQPVPDAYPVTKPLVAIVGDSIANGDQTPGWQTWAFSMLNDLSQTHPDVQLLNDAFNGGGIPTVKNSTYSEDVLPWYSAARAKNVLIVAAGTNDLLNGTGSLSDILDRYYGLLQSARATGWKTVASTVLPRSDASAMSGTFEAARVAFNADLRAHTASYDALADVASIPGLGAAGDSDNLTYYSLDKVHPIAAGHTLLEPVYRGAVAGLLTTPAQ